LENEMIAAIVEVTALQRYRKGVAIARPNCKIP
jgi:hypothetical protein